MRGWEWVLVGVGVVVVVFVMVNAPSVVRYIKIKNM
jgi:hypothetical protein